MGPIAALDSVFTKFFTLRGRASCSEYWWFRLMQIVILLVAIPVDLLLMDPDAPLSLNPFSYFTSMWLILTIIPNFTVTVRRLHDTGRSGVYYFVTLVPFVGGILFLIIMCMPSDGHQNHWGNPPFGPRASTYDGHDPSALGSGPMKAKPSNPYAGYALLDQANQDPTPEMIAARKDEVRALYQTRVLGQKPTLQDG